LRLISSNYDKRQRNHKLRETSIYNVYIFLVKALFPEPRLPASEALLSAKAARISKGLPIQGGKLRKLRHFLVAFCFKCLRIRNTHTHKSQERETFCHHPHPSQSASKHTGCIKSTNLIKFFNFAFLLRNLAFFCCCCCHAA